MNNDAKMGLTYPLTPYLLGGPFLEESFGNNF